MYTSSSSFDIERRIRQGALSSLGFDATPEMAAAVFEAGDAMAIHGRGIDIFLVRPSTWKAMAVCPVGSSLGACTIYRRWAESKELHLSWHRLHFSAFQTLFPFVWCALDVVLSCLRRPATALWKTCRSVGRVHQKVSKSFAPRLLRKPLHQRRNVAILVASAACFPMPMIECWD